MSTEIAIDIKYH